MKLQVKTRYVIFAGIGVLLGLFFYAYHLGHKRAESVLNALVTEKEHELVRITLQSNDKIVYLTKANQEILTLREAKKSGLVDLKALKALNLKYANEISKLKIRIDTLLENIDHSGEVVVVYDTITEMPKNALLLPFSFEKNDPWLDLSGSLSSQATLDISLAMSLEIDAISGIEKKSKEPFLSITTDNPYINVIGVRSYKTDTHKPTRWGIGLNIGYGVSKDGLSPYVGLGLSRNIIRF